MDLVEIPKSGLTRTIQHGLNVGKGLTISPLPNTNEHPPPRQ